MRPASGRGEGGVIAGITRRSRRNRKETWTPGGFRAASASPDSIESPRWVRIRWITGRVLDGREHDHPSAAARAGRNVRLEEPLHQVSPRAILRPRAVRRRLRRTPQLTPQGNSRLAAHACPLSARSRATSCRPYNRGSGTAERMLRLSMRKPFPSVFGAAVPPVRNRMESTVREPGG